MAGISGDPWPPGATDAPLRWGLGGDNDEAEDEAGDPSARLTPVRTPALASITTAAAPATTMPLR